MHASVSVICKRVHSCIHRLSLLTNTRCTQITSGPANGLIWFVMTVIRWASELCLTPGRAQWKHHSWRVSSPYLALSISQLIQTPLPRSFFCIKGRFFYLMFLIHSLCCYSSSHFHFFRSSSVLFSISFSFSISFFLTLTLCPSVHKVAWSLCVLFPCLFFCFRPHNQIPLVIIFSSRQSFISSFHQLPLFFIFTLNEVALRLLWPVLLLVFYLV